MQTGRAKQTEYLSRLSRHGLRRPSTTAFGGMFCNESQYSTKLKVSRQNCVHIFEIYSMSEIVLIYQRQRKTYFLAKQLSEIKIQHN